MVRGEGIDAESTRLVELCGNPRLPRNEYWNDVVLQSAIVNTIFWVLSLVKRSFVLLYSRLYELSLGLINCEHEQATFTQMNTVFKP